MDQKTKHNRKEIRQRLGSLRKKSYVEQCWAGVQSTGQSRADADEWAGKHDTSLDAQCCAFMEWKGGEDVQRKPGTYH
ncbi:hypothetical protein E2C01_091515 [Portunus trituberculatus]|uniref:Uncharacterized protein n=1 Tax=Portunus trituberculatus TaxID=210409 RepID=A0A5B7JPK9_PORTR|nr:hypothetical protein [Portunus trituberculatus]